jgi:hypothetical protein
MIDRALAFTLAYQRDDGAIAWRAPEGHERLEDLEVLLAGGSAIYKSLECAIRAFAALDRPTDRWRAARARLGAAIRDPGTPWAPKTEFAMDWYYPALAGAQPRTAARARLAEGWKRFVDAGWGCRCVANEPWTTAAETAELAIALAAAGAPRLARRALATLDRLATPNGDVWMGFQFRDGCPWPEERPSWTAGAALIAEDVARGASAGASVFLDALPEDARAPVRVSRYA